MENILAASFPGGLLDAWNISAANNPHKTAVVDSHNLALSFKEVDELASRIGLYLLKAGLQPGDVVTCQLPGWAEFLPIYIACLKIGAVINPVPPNLRQWELHPIIERCQSRALIVPRSYRHFTYCDMAAELQKNSSSLRTIISVDKFGEGSKLPTLANILEITELAEYSVPKSNLEDLAAIVFTSGSEGEAKGVMFSHKNLLSAELSFIKFFGITNSDIMFMPAPVAHAIGFHHGVTMPFILGATTILQDKFVAEEAIKLINKFSATLTMATTPFLYDLVLALKDVQTTMPSLRFFLCGGTPPNLNRVAEARQYGVKVLNVYGSTESVPHMGTPPDATEEQWRRQALFPMPGINVRLVDCNGRDVSDGKEGEEISASDAVFMGYIGNPEATARTLRAAWCYSGDLCRKASDGSYSITGRIKDIIVRGGENISCLEVETILLEHGDIAEAAVVSMPDARLQERICAYVTLKDSTKSITLKDIAAHFEEHNVARIKCPEHLEILTEMPRGHSGKINKSALRELISKKN